MNSNFTARRMSEHVYWVGAIDPEIRDFHGYSTNMGTTYNAYLIIGDENILIDTVKKEFFSEMIARISSVINPEEISYIISNHAEMDHSGSLLQTINVCNPKGIFASKLGIEALKLHFNYDINFIEIKDKQYFNLGSSLLNCIETKMLHWPDSMFTYYANDKILFSQDAFGMHLATDNLFASKNEKYILKHQAMKYFANILLPYTTHINNLLCFFNEINFDIKVIAPDHGPIWDELNDLKWIVSLWSKWAQQQISNKVVICYDTMWNSTSTMARMIAEGVSIGNGIPILMSMSSTHRSDVATELLEAGAFIVGSPTINNQIFPTIADLICYMKGLKRKNMIGQVFGSYGWSGEAIKILQLELSSMEIALYNNHVKTKYVPKIECLKCCHNLGQDIAKKLINY